MAAPVGGEIGPDDQGLQLEGADRRRPRRVAATAPTLRPRRCRGCSARPRARSTRPATSTRTCRCAAEVVAGGGAREARRGLRPTPAAGRGSNDYRARRTGESPTASPRRGFAAPGRRRRGQRVCGRQSTSTPRRCIRPRAVRAGHHAPSLVRRPPKIGRTRKFLHDLAGRFAAMLSRAGTGGSCRAGACRLDTRPCAAPAVSRLLSSGGPARSERFGMSVRRHLHVSSSPRPVSPVGVDLQVRAEPQRRGSVDESSYPSRHRR